MERLNNVVFHFGIDPGEAAFTHVQHGLINHTWKVTSGKSVYILQKVNTDVFKIPQDVAYNTDIIASQLSHHNPGYIFAQPLKTIAGNSLYMDEAQHYYRMFPFVDGSCSRNSVETVQQAYEAARQFGRFTAALKNFDTGSLKVTIPFFHDLGHRYSLFLQALEEGDPVRIAASASLIRGLKKYYFLAEHFEKIKTDPQFRLRVTHHDTKISNVLFDKNDKGICVIDLDTVMPGYFISDVGDMMRTYLCPVTEEETDDDKIIIRPEIYDAIVSGYLSEMEQDLSDKEKQHFFYAGSFMICMQALRFLTDHLYNDRYYGAAYEGHNYNRARNQFVLLEEFMRFRGSC